MCRNDEIKKLKELINEVIGVKILVQLDQLLCQIEDSLRVVMLLEGRVQNLLDEPDSEETEQVLSCQGDQRWRHLKAV